MLNESFGRLADAQTMMALRRTARSLFSVVYEGRPRITRRLVDVGGDHERYILRFTSPVMKGWGVDGMRVDGSVCGRTIAAAYVQAIEDMGERLREQADESYDEYSDGWLKEEDDDEQW